MQDNLIAELFEAGAHIGRSKSRRHPKMSCYVFGTRSNIEIFNLQATEAKLGEAEVFLKQLGKENKLVLWVGTKPAARMYIKEVAMRLGHPYIVERWLGGILTNFKVLEARLKYWQQLEREAAEGLLEKYVKKERLLKLNELRKLARMFGGLRALTTIPDAIVIIDPGEELTAQREAIKKKVPVVGLLNTDCNPTEILYPIPLNDDAAKVIQLVTERLGSAYEAGKQEGVSQ